MSTLVHFPGRNQAVRKERLKELVGLLVTHDMKRINEEFYDLISGENGNPYGVNWSLYDSLTPSEDGRVEQ